MNTKLDQQLIQLSAMPNTQTVKFNIGDVRDQLARKSFYQVTTAAAVAILGWFADNTQISFEERKNIDILTSLLEYEPTMNSVELMSQLNVLVPMVNHYTEE